MIKIIKKAVIATVVLGLLATALVYGTLSVSLASLSGSTNTQGVAAQTLLSRDTLGTAIIQAENRQDAAYALGYAHGQDRFFQMDLLRRNAAGELSELFGEKALGLDKRMRFHQFRKRSQAILKTLPESHLAILKAYALGVNEAIAHIGYPSFEYLVTGAKPAPWSEADSLLVIFTMYLDLQTKTFERDLVLTQLNNEFGQNMVAFLTQPNHYQSALDGSEFALTELPIPSLKPQMLSQQMVREIDEPLDVGSNNWAVMGELTSSGHAMLSDDMHLGLAVPVIWYRAQLNYSQDDTHHQITGVTLPGAPAVVVGGNGDIAWGFTNAYIDTADWVKLDETVKTTIEVEMIKTLDGEHEYHLEMSPYGPVKLMGGEKYALSWVAHQDYAVDMELINLERVASVSEALNVAKTIGIPVQNMMVVDKQGHGAWQATGAIPGRKQPVDIAMTPLQFDTAWHQDATDVPFIENPENARLWTANSRVVSTEQDARFGNGGYALGARQAQIKARLFEQNEFNEADFYRIQLDNEARFLAPWQTLLLQVLNSDKTRYAQDIEAVKNWQACACPDSVGYTLVRKYRSAILDKIFAPVENTLVKQGLSLKPIKRDLEPAAWQIINAFPDKWLTGDDVSWPQVLTSTYATLRDKLLIKHTGHKTSSISALTWGEVNALKVQHPFSKQMPILSKLLDMPTSPGFGDSFMPAVQRPSSGASQRLIIQPGNEQDAILTLPGGQSGHPLSPFYRTGFSDYVEQKNTPFLPSEAIHQITFKPVS